MNEDLLALGRRAVACSGWRWLPGMGFVPAGSGGQRWRIVQAGDDTSPGYAFCECCQPPERLLHTVDDGEFAGDIPDMSDVATVGCLLALVRDAWGDPTAVAAPVADDDDEFAGWMFCANRGAVTGPHGSEAEALVAALESARVSRVRGAPDGGERGP